MDENGIYPKWWPLKVRKKMINQCVVWMHKTHTDIHIYIYAHLVFGQTQMMSIYKTHQVGIQAAENKMIWEEYTFGFRLQNVSSGVKDVWMSIQRANRIVIPSDQFFMFIDSYLDIHIYIYIHIYLCVCVLCLKATNQDAVPHGFWLGDDYVFDVSPLVSSTLSPLQYCNIWYIITHSPHIYIYTYIHMYIYNYIYIY